MPAVNHRADDRIHIEQLEVSARIGVSDAEREKPQRLLINMTLSISQDCRDLNDEISQTADYSAVCHEAKNFAEKTEHRLIETLADRLAMLLLKKFSVRRVEVEVRKFVLPNAAYASVMVSRMAPLD